MSLGELIHDVASGNFEHAGQRISDWWHTDGHNELDKLVKRLTSDGGKIAEQVARDAWENWQEGDDLLTIARKAAEEALARGLEVAEQDIADWLGIIDRNA